MLGKLYMKIPSCGMYFLFFLQILFIYFFTLQYFIGFAIHQHESTIGTGKNTMSVPLLVIIEKIIQGVLLLILES